jgi:hypothetical protein
MMMQCSSGPMNIDEILVELEKKASQAEARKSLQETRGLLVMLYEAILELVEDEKPDLRSISMCCKFFGLYLKIGLEGMEIDNGIAVYVQDETKELHEEQLIGWLWMDTLENAFRSVAKRPAKERNVENVRAELLSDSKNTSMSALAVSTLLGNDSRILNLNHVRETYAKWAPEFG